MKDETLLKISFLGAIIFLLLSIYAYYFITTPIANITKDMIGKSLCVKGDFYLEREVKSCVIGKLVDKTGKIIVFACKNSFSEYEKLKNIKKIKNVKICGKIKEYKGSLEIIPFKIYFS